MSSSWRRRIGDGSGHSEIGSIAFDGCGRCVSTGVGGNGEVNNYGYHKKIIAYAGVDPSVHESGNFVGMSKLSKRGNRHLRRAIYLMTASVVSQNAFFKAYFLKGKK